MLVNFVDIILMKLGKQINHIQKHTQNN